VEVWVRTTAILTVVGEGDVTLRCHCEERSDAAIPRRTELDCRVAIAPRDDPSRYGDTPSA
jgi:hypothetical protein